VNRNTLVDIGEITDSREVLSEKPHRAMSAFAYLLIALLAAAIIWMCVGEIDYYVKAPGEVRPNDLISTIRSTATGTVAESRLEEGRQVRRGELLFRVDAEIQENTEAVLARQYDSMGAEIACLEKYRESIIRGENLFDESDAAEADYYYRFQKYETDMALAVEQARNTNTDYGKIIKDAEIQLETSGAGSAKYASERSAWQLLKASVERGENLVPPANAEQYGGYVDYSVNARRYEIVTEQRVQAKERAEALFEAGGISQKELETAVSEYDLAVLEADAYRNEVLLGADRNIASLDRTIRELDAQGQSARAAIEAYSQKGYDERLIADKSRLDALTATSDTIFSLQNNLDSLYKDLVQVRLSIAEASVYAPIDGTVNLYSELGAGDYVQTGSEIATIVPDTQGALKIQIAVSNADIAELQIGQEVRYRFAALPYSDYGELGGAITNISSDARRDSGGNSYYLIEGELSGDSLSGREGAQESVKVGMTAEARVITHTRKIVYWVLDKLNFIDD
jgi:HlyD family secretion protein